jgi:hypothetical protein
MVERQRWWTEVMDPICIEAKKTWPTDSGLINITAYGVSTTRTKMYNDFFNNWVQSFNYLATNNSFDNRQNFRAAYNFVVVNKCGASPPEEKNSRMLSAGSLTGSGSPKTDGADNSPTHTDIRKGQVNGRLYTNANGSPYADPMYFKQSEKYDKYRSKVNEYFNVWHDDTGAVNDGIFTRDKNRYNEWEKMHDGVIWFDTAACV